VEVDAEHRGGQAGALAGPCAHVDVLDLELSWPTTWCRRGWSQTSPTRGCATHQRGPHTVLRSKSPDLVAVTSSGSSMVVNSGRWWGSRVHRRWCSGRLGPASAPRGGLMPGWSAAGGPARSRPEGLRGGWAGVRPGRCALATPSPRRWRSLCAIGRKKRSRGGPRVRCLAPAGPAAAPSRWPRTGSSCRSRQRGQLGTHPGAGQPARPVAFPGHQRGHHVPSGDPGCVNPTWPHQDGANWLHLT